MTGSRRPFRALLTAISLAQAGTAVSVIALPWFVLVTTGSATSTGLTAFCELVPYVLCKGLTGPVVDRLGARLISWTADAVSALAVGLVPLLHALDLLPLWALLLLVALVGTVRGPGDLSKDVLLPETAELGGVPLERATGLLGVVNRLASTVGPVGGGAAVAVAGPMTALLLNAAAFLGGSLIIGGLLPTGVGRPADGPGQKYWEGFREGVRFLRGEPLVITVTALFAATNLLDAALSSVLLPVWARESGHGPSAIGLVAGAMGVTALGGSLLAAVYAARLPRRPVFLTGFLIAGAPRFLVLALDLPLWLVTAVFAASGFGAGFVNPIIGAVLLERIPRPLLGRVRAIRDSVVWAGIPVGGLLGGLAASAAGPTLVLTVAGLGYLLVTLFAVLRPEWRQLDRPGTALRRRTSPLLTRGCRPDLPSDRGATYVPRLPC
ncbi:MFS transporter permease [Kitasatospora sp. Root187]|uniref:MFS transporter n=1 Tax=Kitasatospora sp. Root187 TaxID=1736486 RepID=UPI00070F92DA|nr:MFS transporter [Kitasatospora sp. Root187]KRB70048.1 MFS transporter permease [Kitasatospora sp. Root187]